MSVIMGIKTNNIVILGADKRLSTYQNQFVSDENDKILVVNNHLALACAGNKAIQTALEIDINKLEIESKEENKTKLKPISNKWSTPNNTINKTKGQFKIVRKGKDKSFKTVKIDNRLSINKLTKPIKNEYLSKPVISILNKKGSEDNTVTLSKQIPNAFFCNAKKRNELNFLGKISNVIKGKKEVVLPMIVQKSVINSYKDSVNGKRSAVNINHIDKM